VVFLNVEYFFKKNLFFFSLFFLSFSHLLSYYLPEIKKFDWRNGLYCVVYFPVFQGEKFKILYFIQQTCKKKNNLKNGMHQSNNPYSITGAIPISLLDGKIHGLQPLTGFLIFFTRLLLSICILHIIFHPFLFNFFVFIIFYAPPISIHFASSISFYFVPLWVREHSIPPNLCLDWK